MENKQEKAIFAAGCFWSVEEAFRTIKGVVSTRVGYAGGEKESPTYEQVCSGATGHAEAVEVTFDSEQISYEVLVRKFFEIHDPTQINRQGPDVGDQYRSAIFYTSPEQSQVAEKIKQELDQSGKYPDRIATEIVPAETFYEAEDYHQQYIKKGGAAACQI